MIIRSPIVTERKALSEMQHTAMNRFFGAFFNRSKRDYSRMLEDPTSSSLIMAVMLWIVRRWQEAPLYLEQGDDAVHEHPMLAKINRPNPYYSGAALWFGTIMSFIWDGNGYWVKVKSKRDLAVTEIWYVPHFLMEPMVNEGSKAFVDYYLYSPGGTSPVKILPEDVVHFRYGIDPYNPRKGFSPLKSIARDAVTDEEADNFAASMLLNMGVPGLIVSPDVAAGQMVNDNDLKDAKKFFEDQFTGGKRGKPLVMRGATKVVQFGFDPKSMDLAALRGIPEERVSAVTGVPAAVVGFGSGLAQTKVGATMKELREMAYEDGIIPLQRLIGPELETQLLDDFEPNPDAWKVRFDLSEVRVLQEDQDALYKRTIDAFNGGVINRAQAKQAMGMEALPTDEFRRVPFSVTEVPDGMAVEAPEPLPKEPAPGASPIPDPKAPADPEEKPKEDPDAQPAKGRAVETKSIGAREKAFAAIQLRYIERHKGAYRAELEDGFIAIADRVLAAYESSGLASRAPGGRKEEGDQATIDPNSPEGLELAAQAQKLAEQAAHAGALSDELAWKGHYLAVASSTAGNVKAIFGIALDNPDPAMREVVAKGGKHIALVDVQKQTQDAIFKALAEGRAAGLGPRELARLIRSQVEGAAMYPGVAKEAYDRAIARGWAEEKARAAGDKAARQYRAEVIARTETKYAQNVSTIEVARGSGTFDGMLCFDAQKGPTDQECELLNGQVVGFDEAQRLADDEHPNGTRSFSPTIGGA